VEKVGFSLNPPYYRKVRKLLAAVPVAL